MVKLISVTQDVTGKRTPNELVAYKARVSNPANQDNVKTAKGLLTSLIRDGHWSPLEMVDACMEITTTRDIGRQIIRHRSFVFQEFSQRYAKVIGGPIFREARMQDTKNRQNSLPLDRFFEDKETMQHLQDEWYAGQICTYEHSQDLYDWALEKGIAKEQARAILPEGMTPTTMYMKGSLRSWIHYCQLRMANGTQKEHAYIAKECWELLKTVFPDIIDAVEELEQISGLKDYLYKILQTESPETFQKIKLDFLAS